MCDEGEGRSWNGQERDDSNTDTLHKHLPVIVEDRAGMKISLMAAVETLLLLLMC